MASRILELEGLRFRLCHQPAREPRSAPHVLALHGFLGTAEDWLPVIEASDGRLNWWMPDLVGHGHSDAPEDLAHYQAPALLRQLDLILYQLDLEAPILLGYSMGGRLALHYAAHRQAELGGLITLGSHAGIRSEKARRERWARDEKLADELLEKPLARFLEEWLDQPLLEGQKHLPESIRLPLFARRLAQRPEGLSRSLRGFGAAAMPVLWSLLMGIRCRTLFLAGSEDIRYAIEARRMAMHVSGSEHVQVFDAGHTAHLEQPTRFARLIEDWICGEELAGEEPLHFGLTA